MTKSQKITPCLWFDTQAEEAANFYVSIFKNSRLRRILRYGEAGHEIHGRPSGSVMIVEFELDGQAFTALNGGPQFKFNEALSLEIGCETQEEIDYFWEKLCDGGEESQCGWLKDRYGVSWQIVPTALGGMLGDPDPKRSERVMQVLLKMKKPELPALERAYAGR